MGQGEGEWLLVCTGVFSGGHENVLELDGNDGGTTSEFLVPLNLHFKMEMHSLYVM